MVKYVGWGVVGILFLGCLGSGKDLRSVSNQSGAQGKSAKVNYSETYSKIEDGPFPYAERFSPVTPEHYGVYRSSLGDRRLEKARAKFKVDYKSMLDVLDHGAKLAGAYGHCIGRINTHSQVIYEDYDQVKAHIEQLGYAIHLISDKAFPIITNEKEKRQDGKFRLAGMFGPTSVEWLKVFYTLSVKKITSVMIHSTSAEDAYVAIVNQTGLQTLFVAPEQVSIVAQNLPKTPSLKWVIVMGTITEHRMMPFQQKKISIILYEHLYAAGAKVKENDQIWVETRETDIHTISFTSGSTGPPKGVMLTYGNLLSTVMAMHEVNHKTFEVDVGDVLLAFLPLSHVYSMVATAFMHMMGGVVTMWRGDLKLLPEDHLIARPHVLAIVPAVAKRMINKIEENLEAKNKLMRFLANKALGGNRSKPHKLRGSMWDRIFGVSKKILKAFGGNLKTILNAGGKMDAQSHLSLQTYLGVPIVNGYGLTETTGPSHVQSRADFSSHDILGGPIPIVEYRVLKHEEFSDLAKTDEKSLGIGELQVRGQSVFVGYYGDAEKTNEVLDKDGWFSTGDIVEMLPGGALRMRDRAKSLIKLAQGLYVATEQTESTYGQSANISQIWVFAEDKNRTLKAIIVPNKEAIMKSQKWEAETYKTKFRDGGVLKIIKEDTDKLHESSKMQKFQKLNGIHLEPLPWLPASGLITPTMKLKRPKLKIKYAEVYKKLCDENE